MNPLREMVEKYRGEGLEPVEPELDEANWPADVERYYQECMKKQPGKGKEYCARVAWSIFCAHKKPDYPGCTKFGKKWGKPYSKPLSAEVEGCSPCEAAYRERQALVGRLLAEEKPWAHRRAVKPTHERCPKGSHWNDVERECMRLPGHLMKAVRQADAGSEPHPSLSSHQELAHHYDKARDQHYKTAQKLHQHGFVALATVHSNRGREASRMNHFHQKVASEIQARGTHRGVRESRAVLRQRWESFLAHEANLHEATPHERCPKGKHWNDNSHKCEKIPVGVKLHIATANEFGARAHEDSNDAETASSPKIAKLSHANAAHSHASAKRFHQIAAGQLAKAGFSQAAAEHEKRAGEHEAHEVSHGGKADPELLQKLKAQNPWMKK